MLFCSVHSPYQLESRLASLEFTSSSPRQRRHYDNEWNIKNLFLLLSDSQTCIYVFLILWLMFYDYSCFHFFYQMNYDLNESFLRFR